MTTLDETRELEGRFEEYAAQAPDNFWIFLSKFCRTIDNHDPTTDAKPFPEKAMYRVMARIIQETGTQLFTEKSRQVMMTWIMCAYMLWDSLFNNNRLNFCISKKDDDAEDLIDRIRIMFDNLVPIWPGDLPMPKRVAGRTGTKDKIVWQDRHVQIRAIPRGANVVRMHTCTNILSDEQEHQDQPDEVHAAASPTLSGGGKFFGQGTVNGFGWAYRVLYGIDENTGEVKGPNRIDSRWIDRPPIQPPPQMDGERARYWIEDRILSLSEEDFRAIPLDELVACMPGMEYWVTAGGIPCMRVHYSADPDKSPETAAGRAWIVLEEERYPERAKWLREMEMDRATREGKAVITSWRTAIHVRNHQYDYTYGLVGGVDFGGLLACCFLAQYVLIPNFNVWQLRILDEIVVRGGTTFQFAQRIVQRIKARYAFAWEQGDVCLYVDPAGNQTTATTNDKSLNTDIKIFQSMDLRCKSHKYGLVESTEFMRTGFAHQLPNGEMAIVCNARCEYWIQVFGGGLRYPKVDDGKQTGKYEKDGVNDHGGDAGRHLINWMLDPKMLNGSNHRRSELMTTVRRAYGTGRPLAIQRHRAVGRFAR